MIKVNKYISLAIVAMFILEVSLLLFSDFSHNTGVTKGIAILYFLLTYIWFTIPAFISILFSNKIAERKLILMILLCLNILIFIGGIPMFISYLS
jgi:hypothetical protein